MPPLRRGPTLQYVAKSISSPPFITAHLFFPSVRCTIYTAVYKDQQVVVKLMRKDVHDPELVRDELDLELALLRR